MDISTQPAPFIDLRRSTSLRPLTFAWMFSFALVPPTLLLLLLDQRILDDELLWLKPLKFQISVGALCLTIAAAILVLPQRHRTSLWVRLPAWAVSITAIYELTFLAIQAGRRTRSHFNSDTLFDQIAGILMAAGASVLVGGALMIGLVILAVWIAKGKAALSDPTMLAVGLGLVIGGFLGGYTGSYIGMNAGPFVGDYLATDPTWPIFGWSRTIGDLRIAHFLGLHAMQAIPLVTPAAVQFLSPTAAMGVTVATAGAWTWLTLASLSAAQVGLPFLQI